MWLICFSRPYPFMLLDLTPLTVHPGSQELSQSDIPCLYASNALPDLVHPKSGRARPISSSAASYPHATVRETFTRPSRPSGIRPRPRACNSRSTRTRLFRCVLSRQCNHSRLFIHGRHTSGAAVWCFALLYASVFAMWPMSVSAMPTPTTALARASSPCATCTPPPFVLPRQLESVSASPSEASSTLPQESSVSITVTVVHLWFR